jgi:GT2 family glycosyltransferase
MLRHGLLKWVFMDQDVRVTADGWLDDMLAVFAAHPMTGIVGWRCISDQLCKQPIGDGGLVPQMPGACCMFSAECVKMVGGWDHRFLYYRAEDTAFCFAARDKGFTTRLVMGEQRILHDHPGSGMARNARDVQVRAVSEAMFRQMAAARNWPDIP